MAAERASIESLLAFWADAGVEAMYAAGAINRTIQAETSARRSSIPGTTPSTQSSQGNDVALAVEMAAAASDLHALKGAIADFEGCSLKAQGATRSVFFRGAIDAPVMIIGEAPGAEEDAQGEPFVGRAGRLLNKMLAAAGLEGRVFITNTVFWRPPGNRTPTRVEQSACAPFLERAIQLLQPRCLLLVGAASARHMLDRSDGILALRGRWLEWRSNLLDLEIPAMPTLHPAFLLRQPVAKRLAWRDLLVLAERIDRAPRSG